MLARIRSEVAYATGLVRVVRATRGVTSNPTRTLGDYLADWAAAYGDRPALYDDRETLTYRALDARANAYARWARGLGYGKGDTLALMMPNRPEYVAIWFGLVRAGVGVALVNTNLTGSALAHSLTVVSARAVIVDASMTPALAAARAQVSSAIEMFAYGASAEPAPRIDLAVAELSQEPLRPHERPALSVNDPALYVYTSGTTGLPKAARITHSRALRIMLGFCAAVGARASDRSYICLPMYHTNGGVIAPGLALPVGGCAYIREKFSASAFWKDAIRERCTLFVYIGEVCRYLYNAPPSPQDRSHPIRACLGNGLRPDMFAGFQQRFGVHAVFEFYAATEGNAVMINFDHKPGVIGRIPSWAASRFPTRIVAFDVDENAHPRDAAGHCRECGVDETGELVAEIRDDPKYPAARFDGYADRAATEAKILRDVFRDGDAWFRTGDLVRRDARGYFHFIDRIGDTFRWKGENVSTSEVEETIVRFPGVREAVVYGVRTPGHDGRAGMATLVVDSPADFDFEGLRSHLAAALPVYARPLFLRFRSELEVTGTFKPKKTELVAEGFDLERVREPLYFDDRRANAYRRMDSALVQALTSGALAL